MTPSVCLSAVKRILASQSISSRNRAAGMAKLVAVCLLALCATTVAYATGPRVIYNGVVSTLGSGFSYPYGVAVDGSGNVYVADGGNNAVKEILAVGGVIPSSPTIKMLGSGFSGPISVAVDGSGNVYVANYSSSTVKEILAVGGVIPSNPTINTLGSGFSLPTGVAVDGSGNVYVADYNHNAVKEIEPAAVSFGTVNVGSTSAAQTLQFTVSSSIAIGSIQYLTQGVPNLDFNPLANDPSNSLCAVQTYSATTNCILDVTFTPTAPGTRSGAVVIKDNASPANVLATVYLSGTGAAPQVTYPTSSITTSFAQTVNPVSIGVAVDASQNFFVSTKASVLEFKAGCFSLSCATTVGGGFSYSAGLALDGAGNLYVADYIAPGIDLVPPGCGSAACMVSLGGGFSNPFGVAVDLKGNVYVDDTGAGQLKMMPPNCFSSSCVSVIGGGLGSSIFNLAVDTAGNVYVANPGFTTIKQVPAGCTSSACVVSLGGGFVADGVAVDGMGNIFVADTNNFLIKKMSPTCASSACVTTVASGTDYPSDVAVDSSGNLYVVSAPGSTISLYNNSTPPTVSFPTSTTVGTTDSTDGTKTVTISNNGNLDLVFPAPITGTNASISAGFTQGNSETCPNLSTTSSPATLTAGSSCTYIVSFTPTAAGSTSGSLVLTNNNLNGNSATQSIPLSGTGLPSVTGFVITNLPATGTAGVANAFTVTAYTTGNAVATNYTGTIKLSSTDPTVSFPSSLQTYTFVAGDAGVHTFTATTGVVFKIAGTQTLVVTDTTTNVASSGNSIVISPAAPSHFTAVYGDSQSKTIGSVFTIIQARVTDTYGNSISGLTVNFTAPTSGASASLNPTSIVTNSSGIATVSPTANGIAGTYNISATVSGNSGLGTVTFPETNTAASPTLAVTAATTTLVYGQPVTITATSSTPTLGGSSPTGAVTFYDNTTTLTPTATPVTGVATFSTTALVGAQTYGASTAADNNFNAVTKTTAAPITVSKASSTLTGPTTQPVMITVGTTGSIPVTVTGQYSGTGVSTPSGTVAYIIQLPCATNCTGTTAITAGAATVPTPSTLSPGLYTVSISYVGDTNYSAATGISVQIQVGQLTPTVTYPAQTAITYGTALTSNLNATTAYTTTSLTSGGTTAYTATLGSGSPVAVTAATVLTPGTYTLTATWTPNSSNSTLYKSASGTTTLVVNKAPLTVTVNAATSVYGATFPTFTGTLTGVVTGDGITASYSTTATTTSTPGGSYSITATLNDPNSKLSNYTVTNTPTTLTISKAPLAVTVNAATSIYGVALPTFTGTVTGVVSGDGITASYSTTATSSSTSGSYSVT
ncbi:MAG: MBG domain-containing protein, partial [Acidobacteriaceae bacterium]|nr:MBG domain-containing protein [Acidobacteriaceae bacterium]